MHSIDSTNVAERTMSLTAANIAGLALMPLLILVAVMPYLLLQGTTALANTLSTLSGHPATALWLLLSFVIGIFVHEGLHALAWGAIAGFQNIKFGFKEMTPYTHCTVPMPARAYRIGAALPGVLLGILPSIAAALMGSAALLIFSILMMIGAAGDVMILWMLRDLNESTRVQDHPSKVGCLVYTD